MTDSVEFIRNMRTRHLDACDRYAGKNIAWSEDGTQVLAAAEDLSDLYAEMKRLGIEDFVIDFSPTMMESPTANGQPNAPVGGENKP